MKTRLDVLLRACNWSADPTFEAFSKYGRKNRCRDYKLFNSERKDIPQDD